MITLQQIIVVKDTLGSYESAWHVAEQLSRLTDWSTFTEELPKKVRRVITKKMQEIIDETGLRAYSRLG